MAGGIEFNQRKFEELIVYLARRLGPEAALGRVKLAKLLMHSDFTSYLRTGKSITGATYEKRPFGHFPREQAGSEFDLRGHRIAIDVVDYYGLKLKEITALDDPDMSEFSEDEIAIIEGAIKRYGHESAVQLTRLAHREPGWALAKEREEIPYNTALLDSERPPDDDFQEFRVIHGLT
jgi:hypothetical protein